MTRAKQKFLGAVAARNRRGNEAETAPAELFRACANGLADFGMNGRVLHGAFDDILASRFKLRLDQRDEPGARRGERQRMRQNEAQRNEADVADDRAGRRLEQAGVKFAGVESFMRDDMGVFAQAGVELAVADVDGVNAPRAAIEAPGAMPSEALRKVTPSTRTSPASIAACARARLGK